MADRIVIINAGAIEQIGTPLELYNRPDNAFVAGFLGSPRMNLFPARVVAVAGGEIDVVCRGLTSPVRVPVNAPGAAPPSAGAEVFVGIRPEGFADGAAEGVAVDGVVAVVESLGRETLLYVDASPLNTSDAESNDGYVAVHRGTQSVVPVGAPITLVADRRDIFVFDRAGPTITFAQRAAAVPA